jgi:hypothetical protein
LLIADEKDRIFGSICRHEAIANYPKHYDEGTVRDILSDQSGGPFPVFRDEVSQKDYGITLAVGTEESKNGSLVV